MTARVRLRSTDDSERELPLGAVRAGDVRAATPWRTFRSHRNQRHYSGWYWSSTVADHVVYESRLELARLLLADADPDVVGIVAQPFLLIEGVEAKPHRHVPDFFLEHRCGGALLSRYHRSPETRKLAPLGQALLDQADHHLGRPATRSTLSTPPRGPTGQRPHDADETNVPV